MQDQNPIEFPKQADKERLDRYSFNDQLYYGDHFGAYQIKTEQGIPTAYAQLRYITSNFAGLMSRVMADMLFGETITLDFEDPNTQQFNDKLMEENQLKAQLYESSLVNSRRGDSVFKVRIGKRNPRDLMAKPSIIIEEVTAAYYFPEFDRDAARYTPSQDVIINQFREGGRDYLHKEIHTPGYIQNEVYVYDPKGQRIVSQVNPIDFNIKPLEETKINRTLVFHVPNVRDGNFWGTSDYSDLSQLFFALNNRITKVDNILDKHSDPILAVPPGVIDDEGNIRKEALGLFEVDNENPGFNKPEYVVWNANLEAAFTQIDKLLEMLFMFSEIAPATMGMDKEGQAESGRALKFKLLSTIRKRNRKIIHYDQALKDMLEVAQELSLAHGVASGDQKPGDVERPKIKWGDGVINDMTEMVDISVKRVDTGLSTRADEIARLDEVTPDEAKAKVEEIDKEQGPAPVPVVVNNTSGNTNSNNALPTEPDQPNVV